MERPRRAEVLVVAAMVLAVFVGHTWWVAAHRTATAIDGDEARLLAHADQFEAALRSGPSAVARVWTEDGMPTAPLLALATGATFALAGRSPASVEAPIALASAVLTAAAWAVARQIGAGPRALLAAAGVALMPGVVAFSRAHHQIVPGAAALMMVVAAGLATDELRHRRRSMWFGATIGGALLLRAMLVGLVPLAVLAWVPLIGVRSFGRQRWENLLVAVAVAVLVAAPWWIPSGLETLRYLGGGAGAAGSGPVLRSEVVRTVRVVAGRSAGPVAWAVVVGLVVAAASTLRRSPGRAEPTRARYVFIVAIGTFAVLVASRDDFPGFFVIPAMYLPVLASAAPSGFLRRIAVVALVGSIANGAIRAPSADASWYAQQPRSPGIRDGATVEGFGDAYSAIARWGRDHPCVAGIWYPQFDRILLPTQVRWAASVAGIADPVTDMAPMQADRAERLSFVDRAVRLRAAVLFSTGPLEPSAAAIEGALRAAGYRRSWSRLLPDGRTTSIWTPTDRCPPDR